MITKLLENKATTTMGTVIAALLVAVFELYFPEPTYDQVLAETFIEVCADSKDVGREAEYLACLGLFREVEGVTFNERKAECNALDNVRYCQLIPRR